MESVLLALLVAATAPAAPTEGASPAALDVHCFRLMAELSEEEDPRLRSIGRVASQYFLGRIDAASPGFEPSSAPSGDGADRETLLRRCSEVMEQGGRDFRAIGETLASEAETAT